MPKFEKIDINKEEQRVIVFVPKEAEINNQQMQMSPPVTEYESRRCAVGRKAIKQITGK